MASTEKAVARRAHAPNLAPRSWPAHNPIFRMKRRSVSLARPRNLDRQISLGRAQLDQRPSLGDHRLGRGPERYDTDRPRHAHVESVPEWCATYQGEPERHDALAPVTCVRNPER